MKQGLFASIEGGEGMGKSTQVAALAKRLQEEGYRVTQTREPGGTAVGKVLRDLLLHSIDPLAKQTELLLMMADRAHHVETVIKPALNDGQIVLCDRYMDSTYAYQGAGRGWSRLDLFRLHALATGDLVPDITFVMDGVPFKARGTDTFERLEDSFHKRVHDYFTSLPSTATRYVRIDANKDQDVITNELYQLVKSRL